MDNDRPESVCGTCGTDLVAANLAVRYIAALERELEEYKARAERAEIAQVEARMGPLAGVPRTPHGDGQGETLHLQPLARSTGNE